VQADDFAALSAALKKVKACRERWDKVFDFPIDGDDGAWAIKADGRPRQQVPAVNPIG
jgi:hypothetical protein